MELIKDTDQTFQKYRNYYYSLIREMRPLEKLDVPIAAVRGLFARFLVCGQAELDANLLLGDFKQWNYRHKQILAQLAEAFRFERKEVFRGRASAAGLLTSNEHKALQAEVVMTHEFCKESLARIETADQEVRWLEAQRINPEEYFASFKRAPDVGVVMIPHSDP
jgi:hypothetical protein